MADKQRVFEEQVDKALRHGEKMTEELAWAASFALGLDDSSACGALHAYREVIASVLERVEDEKAAVHTRLAESARDLGEEG